MEGVSDYVHEYEHPASHCTIYPSSIEDYWRDRQRFLQSMGYMLRPISHSDRETSQRRTRRRTYTTLSYDGLPVSSIFNTVSFIAHSAFQKLHDHLAVATRIHDGKLVYIRRVKTEDKGARIAIMLSSNSLRYDQRNHCVPILDVFPDDYVPSVSYIVMPFLRPFNELPFEHVNEVVDIVDQLLEVCLSYFLV